MNADGLLADPSILAEPVGQSLPSPILQVLPALERGGVERGTLEMAEAITAAGGVALVASAGGRLVPALERAGGRHLALPLLTRDPVNLLVNAGRLSRVIAAERVALVHARSRAPAWSAWRAARRADVPFVTTWHGAYSETLPGKRLYNSVMARGDRVIAISHYVAGLLLARHRIDPARLRIVHRGVDAELFDPGAVSGDRVHRLAQAWRVPPGAPVVMLPARLTRWKGGLLLLEAIAALPPALRDALFCVFVGGGKPRFGRALAARAERLGLAGRVRLAGDCADMPAALLLADLVVCPSLVPEPFGRAIIEAQAMGRPVIAADHGGAVETVRAGTGFRVAPAPEPLAETMAHVLALGVDARTALGQQARAAVLAEFTTARMQSATLAVYRELA